MMMMGGRSFACINLLGAGVDGADVSDHIGDDCILRAGRMLIIDHNPGHIGMSRIELVSGLCILVHDVISLLASGAGVDGGPVQAVLGGATLSLGVEVGGVVLQADGEGKALTVVVELADGAGLNQVALALTHAVLAGEGPARSVLGRLGIAVGNQVKLADLPEVLRVRRSLQGPANKGEAVGAEGLGVEVDLDLTRSHLQVVTLGVMGVVGEEGGGRQEDAKEDCSARHLKQIFNYETIL